MTIREQWNALLERIGLAPAPDGSVGQHQIDRLGQALSAPEKPEVPAADAPGTASPPIPAPPAPGPSELWEAARPTATEPHEDPSPAEPALSPNAKAYEEDLRCFR